MFWIAYFSHLLLSSSKVSTNEDKFMTLINDFVKGNPGKELYFPINAKFLK